MRRQRYFFWAIIALLVVGVLRGACARGTPSRQPSPEQKAAADRALAWLRSQQKDNGSFDAGFGHPAGTSCDALLAIVTVGGKPAEWSTAAGQDSLLDYLTATASEYAMDAAATSKVISAVAAAGLNPRVFAGRDWIAHLNSFESTPGNYDPGTVGQAWAILALKAAGQKVPAEAAQVLKGYQLETGAWASAFGPDNDTVAYAVQALLAAGEAKDSPAIEKALAFFRTQQNEDGGFPAIKPSEWGTDTNANSTANVIMALLAAGQDPTGQEWTQPGGNPLTALLRLQADDGRIEFQPGIGEPLLSTVQAIPALLNRTLLDLRK